MRDEDERKKTEKSSNDQKWWDRDHDEDDDREERTVLIWGERMKKVQGEKERLEGGKEGKGRERKKERERVTFCLLCSLINVNQWVCFVPLNPWSIQFFACLLPWLTVNFSLYFPSYFLDFLPIFTLSERERERENSCPSRHTPTIFLHQLFHSDATDENNVDDDEEAGN